MLRVGFLGTILLSFSLLASAAQAQNQYWVVTYAKDVVRPDGTPLLYQGKNVQLLELDYGQSVAQVSAYYWVGVTFNDDGTCSLVNDLFGTKTPKPSTLTPYCPTSSGEDGPAFRAQLRDAATDEVRAVRLECHDGSAIPFREFGLEGELAAIGAFGGASPFEPKTINHADYCPEGVVGGLPF